MLSPPDKSEQADRRRPEVRPGGWHHRDRRYLSAQSSPGKPGWPAGHGGWARRGPGRPV